MVHHFVAGNILFIVVLLCSTIKCSATSEAFCLLKFKGNIHNDPFQALISWTSANPLCNWRGVVCDSYDYVTELNLQNNHLMGAIASDIGCLKKLKYLNLQNNSFTGQIPAELGTLTSLLELRLGQNPLSGSIPDNFWSMRAVSFIEISGTNISGSLSSAVKSLQNISYLYLHDNRLMGSLPQEIGTLQTLQIFDIHGNNFSGDFPAEITGLPKIATIDISNNDFVGVVPAGRPGLDFSLSEAGKTAPWKTGIQSSIVAGAVGFLTASVFLLLLGLFLYNCWNIKHITEMPENGQKCLEKDQKPAWTVYTRKFSMDELKKGTKNFSPDTVIGSGGMATVYKAILNTHEILAVKRSREDSQQAADEFHNEVSLLSKIHHKHLANLVGFCEEAGEQILVYEYVPNGSLLEHMLGEKGMPLTWRQRIQIAIDSAKGISYLHEGCSPVIIHRDIKPSNILLDYAFGAKVSDFGLSKRGPDGSGSHVSTQIRGTPGYLDPHYYSSFHLSTLSDVYSFGVILLQLVTAKPALDYSRRRSQYHITEWVLNSIKAGHFEEIIDPLLQRLSYNKEVMLEMSKIGLNCAHKDIKKRPRMSSVGLQLENVLRNALTPKFVYGLTTPEGGSNVTNEELPAQKQVGASQDIMKESSAEQLSKPQSIRLASLNAGECAVDNSIREHPAGRSFNCSMVAFSIELDSLSNINSMYVAIEEQENIAFSHQSVMPPSITNTPLSHQSDATFHH